MDPTKMTPRGQINHRMALEKTQACLFNKKICEYIYSK